MPAHENHYTLLELDVTASTSQIRLAAGCLARKADMLAYTSPEEARALWRRIRRIRADLLSGRKAREAYDLAVISELKASKRSDPAYVPIVFPLPLPAAVRAEIEEQKGSDRVMRWAPLAGVATVLVALILALQPLGVATRRQSEVRSAAPLLANSGRRVGAGYVSGQIVTLSWSGVSGARLYRLQIAATPADPSDRVVFRRPLQTVMTAETFYHLQVVGAQMYYWRVQALVRGHWTGFTHSRHFLVDRPTIESPVALAGSSVAHVKAKRVHLCWSRVAGAAGYRLQIVGLESVTARGSCASLRLYPGAYRWTVAALVRGAHVYTGKPSRPQVLVVSTPQTVRLVAARLGVQSMKPSPTPTSIPGRKTAKGALPGSQGKAVAAATSVSQGKRAEARVRNGRTGRRSRVTPATRSDSVRVVAVRVSASTSSASRKEKQVTRQHHAATAHRPAAVRPTKPVRSSAGRTRSRHRTTPRHQPVQSTPLLPPPPPAPPALPAAVNPAPVAASTAVVPPVVILQVTPATGSYSSVAPSPGRTASIVVPPGGSGPPSVAQAPTPSPVTQPLVVAPTASSAAASHRSGPSPPSAAPPASSPPPGASGQNSGHGQGDDHADQGNRGEHGNAAGRDHAGHPPHP